MATFHFFFITQFEKGLVCVSQLPVADSRRLAVECVQPRGKGKSTQSLHLVAGHREGGLKVMEESEDSSLELWFTIDLLALANSSKVNFYKFLISQQ